MTTKTESQFDRIARLCRHNSGKHMLDSGQEHGRHWQQLPATPETPQATIDLYQRSGHDLSISGTITLEHWINEQFDVLDDLHEQFDKFLEDNDEDWFDAGTSFMESLGYHQHARDNVYNNDNDFSQVFVWEVWTKQPTEPDWLYAKDAVVLLYIHTGCDVRGGYSPPLFVKAKGFEYSMPIDWHVEVFVNQFIKGDLNPEESNWSNSGHCDRTLEDLAKSIERVVRTSKGEWDEGGDSHYGVGWAIVKLKDGPTIRIMAGFEHCC
jgi:hypothetical protein